MLHWFMRLSRFSLILVLLAACGRSVAPTPQPVLEPSVQSNELTPVPTQIPERTQTLVHDECGIIEWTDQTLQLDEEALLQAAFKQTGLSGEVLTMVALTGTSCEYQLEEINYHFTLDVLEQAERATLEQMAHTIQTLVLELKQQWPFDAPLTSIVITWRFADHGCSWGYDYVSHDGESVWYPISAEHFVVPSALLLSDLCTHTEVVESAIPRPDNTSIYHCNQTPNLLHWRLQKGQEALITAAFEVSDIPVIANAIALINGTTCFYQLHSLAYTLDIRVSDESDYTFLQQQSKIFNTILSQLNRDPRINVDMASVLMLWRFPTTPCTWNYNYFVENDRSSWQRDSSSDSPCPQL